MTAVAVPAPGDDETLVEHTRCACGEIADDVLVDGDGVVTVNVRCARGAGAAR